MQPSFVPVYSVPDALPYSQPTYDLAGWKAIQEAQNAHQAQLTSWLRSRGSNGPLTGSIVRFPIGDGYANYMVDDGPTMSLIHLPYYDGYQSPLAHKMTREEIAVMVEREERLGALFKKG